MFKKLLSNLPFNPSLATQVGFYAKRLHHEANLRAVGVVLILLTMFIQLFAVISPPEPSLALSQNDIIPGGFSSREQAATHCNNNDFNFREILQNYQISCDNVANAGTQTIKSTDYNKQLYSMGRIAYGKTGEYPVVINGKTYYMRYLWSWDTIPYSSYKALVGTKTDGTTFMILYNCGNLVIIGKPSPPPPPPVPPAPAFTPTDYCLSIPGLQNSPEQCDVCPDIAGIQGSAAECLSCPEAKNANDQTACLSLEKKVRNVTQNIANADNTTAQAGDVIEYTLTVKNNGLSQVKDFVIEENMTDVLEYATITELGGGSLTQNNILSWPKVSINAKYSYNKKFMVKIKDPLPDTPTATSNPGSYDLVMNNVYGNAVNIKLPSSPIKTTEQVVQTLPNTGPGTSLLIGFGFTTILAYFFARSRLMAKELDIAKGGLDTGKAY